MQYFRGLVLFSVSLGTALSQSDRGTITGTVTDGSGSLIPAALVKAVNPANGAELRAQTTGTGNYTLASMPAGLYNLVGEVNGFRRYEQQGIRVQVAQTARVDVALQVGATTESVTVSGDAPQLRSESAAQATTVGREQLNVLPLNFSIREKISFSVRAEHFNVFNRTCLNVPDSGNALATQVTNPTTGQTISGFGRINNGTTFLPPRSGQIVARFSF